MSRALMAMKSKAANTLPIENPTVTDASEAVVDEVATDNNVTRKTRTKRAKKKPTITKTKVTRPKTRPNPTPEAEVEAGLDVEEVEAEDHKTPKKIAATTTMTPKNKAKMKILEMTSPADHAVVDVVVTADVAVAEEATGVNDVAEDEVGQLLKKAVKLLLNKKHLLPPKNKMTKIVKHPLIFTPSIFHVIATFFS